MEQLTVKSSSKRLYSLDALRGFDMLWIIGAGPIVRNLAEVTQNPILEACANQLVHPDWNGFSFYDLIFPLFIFIAGVAVPLSLESKLARGATKIELLLPIIRRGLMLVLLGVLANTVLGVKNDIHEFANARFPTVLARIGISFILASIIFLYCKRTTRIIWFVALLVGYWLLLKFTSAPGFPRGDLSMEGNFASYIDRLVIPGTLYLKIHDPEGLLSTIPSISTCLMGVFAGDLLKNGIQLPTKKACYLFLAGVIAILLGLLWSLDFPINKNLWTSSFTLLAGGISLVLLALFYFVIDVKGIKKWSFFFRIIGMNAIFIYLSGVFINWRYTAEGLFQWIAQLMGSPYDMVFLSICVLLVKWLFLYFLYKKEVFIRV